MLDTELAVARAALDSLPATEREVILARVRSRNYPDRATARCALLDLAPHQRVRHEVSPATYCGYAVGYCVRLKRR